MNGKQLFLITIGYIVAIVLCVTVARRRHMLLIDKLLLVVVGFIPLGKLIYVPPILASGLKASFLLAGVIVAVWGLLRMDGSIKRKSLLLVATFVLPVFSSVIFLNDYSKLFIYQLNIDQRDSILLRAISQFILVAFMVLIIERSWRSPSFLGKIIDYYMSGLWVAIGIGFLIAIGVFLGVLVGPDIVPVSADSDVHIIGRFFRFNPGSNVNEFGMLLGYGIMFDLLRQRYRPIKTVILLIALFFTLTRAAWIGVLVGLFLYILLSREGKRQFVPLFGIFFVIFAFLYMLSPEVRDLIISRTTLDIGASGQERLGKYSFVIDSLNEEPFRWVFGFGWATNMYVHSVPMQLLYETGLFGLIIYYFGVLFILIWLMLSNTGRYRAIGISLLAMNFTFSLVHHTLYHMQSALVFAVCFILAHSSGQSREQTKNELNGGYADVEIHP